MNGIHEWDNFFIYLGVWLFKKYRKIYKQIWNRRWFCSEIRSNCGFFRANQLKLINNKCTLNFCTRKIRRCNVKTIRILLLYVWYCVWNSPPSPQPPFFRFVFLLLLLGVYSPWHTHTHFAAWWISRRLRCCCRLFLIRSRVGYSEWPAHLQCMCVSVRSRVLTKTNHQNIFRLN